MTLPTVLDVAIVGAGPAGIGTAAAFEELDVEYGGCLSAQRAVLATGFAPVFDHPFVDRVAERLGLERGYRGMPVLDDETLAWRNSCGDDSPLFVTGALAAGTVGPFAGNVVGARRSADRITRALERRRTPAVA